MYYNSFLHLIHRIPGHIVIAVTLFFAAEMFILREPPYEVPEDLIVKPKMVHANFEEFKADFEQWRLEKYAKQPAEISKTQDKNHFPLMWKKYD